MNEIRQHLMTGFESAFIDSTISSNLAYKPQFISNNHKEGRKVLSSIEEELLQCDEFCISVAFITVSGITPLLQTLKILENRGVKGRILTTNYLSFTEPKAITKLAEFSNIELKMFQSTSEGFHTKGYMFKQEDIYRIIVGSSNMTLSALTKNKEWNSKIVSTSQGEYMEDVLKEFNLLWNSQDTCEYDEFIEQYTIEYNLIKRQKQIARNAIVPSIEQYTLRPNMMQVAFIENLKKLQNEGEERALLLSATGTGKTYAAAFALREDNPKKALFVVHREQIAKQAIKSFSNVFGNTKKFGLLSGASKDYEADYLFATMNMMAKESTLTRFAKDEFETIVIDEVHRAGSESYKKIIEYFKPNLYLGMTASPERTDGFDIYKLFDNNIAYEIRLQQAMEEDLLCPFHYFGITELEIDGVSTDEESGLRDFNRLISDTRVDYIIEKAQYYGYSGDRVKGLIFCSRKLEAIELSNRFNKRGFATMVLGAEDSGDVREEAIERLTNDANEKRLDYIFTVDVFNEGVDIPEINQVIMLRPTQSPVVFIQQLGRGLRKSEDKEFVVILDFIGNYNNNFMIPIALSGDRTYNKDNIRRYVMEGERVIPGASTIHFDEVSKQKIFESIDNMNTNFKLLKEKYFELKFKLGKIPAITDFYQYGEIDPMLFIKQAKTYDNFVRKVDKEYEINFTIDESTILEFVSAYVVDGKRIHELLLLNELIENNKSDQNELVQKYDIVFEGLRDVDYNSALNVLNKKFVNSASDKKKYTRMELFESDNAVKGNLQRSHVFAQKLMKKEFKKELRDLITYGFMKHQELYRNHDEDNLVLYQKYSRKDVCRILNWESDDSSTIYGYRIKYNTCPIFVTYHKKEDITSSTKYDDIFINNGLFSWMTRSRVQKSSVEAQKLIHCKESDLKIYLFMKKSDSEGSDFYYMGKVNPVAWKETTIENDKGQQLPIMNFHMELEHLVRTDIYDYFAGDKKI